MTAAHRPSGRRAPRRERRPAVRAPLDTASMSPGELARARSRISAYVYGNVLALAAVIGSAPESVLDGRAIITVLATMATTYLAHLLAHRIGEGVGRSSADVQLHLRAELRDAFPIATSGVLPAVVLLAAPLGWLSPGAAQLLAASVAVVRLATTSVVAGRLGEGGSSCRTMWSAVGLAVLGAFIAAVKVRLTH